MSNIWKGVNYFFRRQNRNKSNWGFDLEILTESFRIKSQANVTSIVQVQNLEGNFSLSVLNKAENFVHADNTQKKSQL